MSEMDDTRTRIRQWNASHATPTPEWWDWAVAAAQYHLHDCDWVTVGISTEHCSCHLTRVIAKIIRDACAAGQAPIAPTPKTRDELIMEAVLAQLRHAYALLKSGGAENWTQRRRIMFADGLIGPQIKRLEILQRERP